MGEVNFYLKKAEDSTGKSLIVLYFRYKGQRLVFSTGETVSPKPKVWNKAKQRVRNNSATTSNGKQYLNAFLQGLQEACEIAYTKALKNGIPSPQTLKQELSNFVNNVEGDKGYSKKDMFNLIDRFIAGEIKYKGRDKSINTIKTYSTLKGHLKEFQSIYKYEINFETITLDFFYKFVDFLSKRSSYEQKIRTIRPELKQKKITALKGNSIAKDIQILKVFMSEAVDLGYTSNLQYKHRKFAVEREDTDAVYLTEKEIDQLYKFDLSGNNKLEKVRDLFVFGSWVGLRFSDFSNIKPENIIEIPDEDGKKEYFIKMITQKTKELVYIPCHHVVLQIFEKYKQNANKLPHTISNQKFNDYIKEVCKLVGLTEKGRLADGPELELWECIGSHTARRSMATNYYLQGFPVIDLMKITGHKTEKAFMRYIRVTKLDAAKRLSAHMKKMWSQKMLRVAS